MTRTAAADRLEDSFPHGTREGFDAGCRGGGCPAAAEHGLSCQRAKSLAAGDYQYQKLVRGGATPAAIAAALGLVPAITAEAPAPVERAPLPIEPVLAAAQPAKWAVKHAWVAFAPDGSMHGPFDDHGEAMEYVGGQLRPARPEPKVKHRPMSTEEIAQIKELHAEGLSDTAIARKLGRVQPVISSWRRRLGLEPNGKAVSARAAS